MRRRTGRKHRETALKILSRRKPPGNVTRLATAVEGPRNKSFAHVLSLHSLCVHVFTIRFSFFLHYAPSFVPLQGTSFGLASPSAPSPCNGEGWGKNHPGDGYKGRSVVGKTHCKVASQGIGNNHSLSNSFAFSS